MPRRGDDDSLPPDLRALIDGMSVDDVRALLPQLLAAGARDLTPSPPPSRRRPPLPDVVTLRVRVDLADAHPPVWRRLELASDLTLDVLHRVLQTAMGWTDSHLHGFSSGASRFDPQAEVYVTDFDIEEGEEGIPEREVRLDELLQDVGDRLYYTYDFGDNWDHRIQLEAVEPRVEGAPPAVCTAGRRSCPPEDVGGVHRYNEVVAAIEGRAHDLDEDLDELRTWLGAEFDPTEFSPESINDRLRFAVLGYAGAAGAGLSTEVLDLLGRLGPDTRPLLEELAARARVGEPVLVDVTAAEQMVAPYAWFLRRLGSDGVKLTAAGYLPPVVVEDVVRELNLGREWIGTGNREHHTWPVLEFRESAQQLGLVRKRNARLAPTVRGRALAADPIGLWQHIAHRLPLGRHESERQAGLVLLLLAAGDGVDGWEVPDVLAAVLTGLGWSFGGARGVSPNVAMNEARSTWDVLRRLGAVTPKWPRGATSISTPAGRGFARAALAAPHA